LFSGDDVDKPVTVLSGGERARVALARLMINPGNLLLMDEPTNHLDLQSSESLADSLKTYDGTLVFVSHNRSLIRNLAEQIWNIEDGELELYPGTLDEYLYSRRMRGEYESDDGDSAAAAPAARKKDNRAAEKQRKRHQAELRNKRYRVLNPVEQRIDKLEARIAKLEEKQKERSAKLSDPAVYDDAAVRNELLGSFQKDQDKLDELTGRWEAAAEELNRLEAELAAEQQAAATAGD